MKNMEDPEITRTDPGSIKEEYSQRDLDVTKSSPLWLLFVSTCNRNDRTTRRIIGTNFVHFLNHFRKSLFYIVPSFSRSFDKSKVTFVSKFLFRTKGKTTLNKIFEQKNSLRLKSKPWQLDKKQRDQFQGPTYFPLKALPPFDLRTEKFLQAIVLHSRM